MNSTFILTALTGISILTSLTVEAIKKLLNEREVKYSSNLLAAIVSIVLTIAVSVCYIIYKDIVISPQVIVMIIAITFLSFLASTTGFDKVKQMIEQLSDVK